jgi:L-lactate dehydrogenase complex protein LldG
VVENALMSDTRSLVLSRIRRALGDVPANETPDDVAVDRTYRTSHSWSRDDLVALFHQRVAEYKATVHRVSAAELHDAIAGACTRRGIQTLGVPDDLPAGWAPAGVVLMRDGHVSHEQLEATDGVLTAASLGIAETGTIVLDGGSAQGRRALTLLPDYHLCVIRADQIVGLVPEAVAQLHAVAQTPGRPITWISGPSATSDIELVRVEGVHGPRTLEVLIVTDASTHA